MVTRVIRTLHAALHRLGSAERGSAAVEFAMILPIMLLVYIGAMEGSTLIIADRKVQSIAGTVGDLVARTDGRLKRSDLQDYFRAASGIMAPYASSDVIQTVTAVKVLANGTTEIEWQGKFQNGIYTEVAKTRPPKSYKLPDAMIKIASADDIVIAAEASYSFKPLFGIVFDQSINLYRSNYFMPRFGEGITLVN